MLNARNHHLVWIDLEMSGLDPEKHVILEIATIITDNQLNIVAQGPTIAVHHSDDVLLSMEPWSREHHTASGLLDRVKKSTHDSQRAEQEIIHFLNEYIEEGESPLCGNSIWQDRRFLMRYMPTLNAYFHYRNIDVSSIKELVKRWYPELAPFEKKNNHLALDDIKESIQELQHYRQHVFRP